MESRVVNTYCSPIPDLDKIGATFLAVLCKRDGTDSYIAYAGLVKLPAYSAFDNTAYTKARAKKAERVARSGLKLTYKQCLNYFSAVKECQYG